MSTLFELHIKFTENETQINIDKFKKLAFDTIETYHEAYYEDLQDKNCTETENDIPFFNYDTLTGPPIDKSYIWPLIEELPRLVADKIWENKGTIIDCNINNSIIEVTFGQHPWA